MPLQATSGAASYDAFGGGVAAVPNYIEECFATHLYTGNGSTQTITNGIDLAGKGGLVWTKVRNSAQSHGLTDTATGAGKYLSSNSTGAQGTLSTVLNAFLSNGYTVGSDAYYNANNLTYASWTFREQPKFFDVVTYTGTGSARTVAHNLGSVPGCMIVKRTDAESNWIVYHRSLGATKYMVLEVTDSVYTFIGQFNNTEPTSTVFTVGTSGTTNASGGTYVAYLFAHNAGGFGLTGTDNVISCGSYTGNGTNGNTVTLNYEPQFLMVKKTNASGGWWMIDTMRGFTVTADSWLFAGSANAETNASSGFSVVDPTSTGFSLTSDAGLNNSGDTYIYIAIRRGPMKVPTTGTSVFVPVISTNNLPAWNTGFPVDMGIIGNIAGSDKMYNAARLMGETSSLKTNTTDAAANWLGNQRFDQMNGYGVASTWGTGYMGWMWRRAPGFFDEVCYNGVSSPFIATNQHNLTVVPEMMICKVRNQSDSWFVYHKALGASTSLTLNATSAAVSSGNFGNTAPTSTQFTTAVGGSAQTLVAYLFASCPGVSKVGSYTGTGTTQTINCGFTGGARFVMIKRTDNTGDWYVWDTARGIVSGNDPHLSLNTTAAEVTSNDTIDTDSTGFVVNQVSATNVNVSSATYIFLAIA
jgi:hypothetical protein